MTKFPSCNGERSWWLLSNDKCLRSATARALWKKGESSAPSVFHAFLGAICERALNLYVCRGGALWLAYHRTQTQSATQWECLFNPSTDIDSYYSYDTRTRQKCFIRTGNSFQPSIRLNSNKCPPNLIFYLFCMWFWIAFKKKETPYFHRPVSIHIDSPLTQGVTQPISRGSDVALHNKSPPNTHIWPVLSLNLDSSKKETPYFHRLFSIQIESPLL